MIKVKFCMTGGKFIIFYYYLSRGVLGFLFVFFKLGERIYML